MGNDDKKRQERLAAALRENLKRRKAQARPKDVGQQENDKVDARGLRTTGPRGPGPRST